MRIKKIFIVQSIVRLPDFGGTTLQMATITDTVYRTSLFMGCYYGLAEMDVPRVQCLHDGQALLHALHTANENPRLLIRLPWL